jgi:hypothetical protein
MDRTNIGNAKLVHLERDLNMSDSQYNAALTIFFVSYSVFEPLTNVLLKRLRPSIFIPIIMVLWVRFIPLNLRRVQILTLSDV